MIKTLSMKKIFSLTATCGFIILATSSALAAPSGSHAEQAGLPQFDVATFPSQIFWLLVAFALLYILFSGKVLPDISAVIERRKQTIDSDLQEAEKLQNEAEEVQMLYEKSLEDAKAAAAETIKSAEEAARKSAEKKLNSFQTKSEKQMNEAVNRIEDQKQEIFAEIHEIAVDVVIASVEKLTGITIDAKTARAAINAQTTLNKKAA